ncbi:MAG: hypothetical protein ABSG33_00610 [Candidatus Bathyarchaeia archaeon]|jgi:predicted transcriptional regulator
MAEERYAYMLIVDKKYWEAFLAKSKAAPKAQAFVRRNQVGPKQVEKLLFYVTGKKQVLGSADFLERLAGNFEDLWAKYGGESCFESFEEYKKFADDRLKMTFIRFSNLTETANPKPKEEVSKVLGSIRGFGAGRFLDKQTAMQLV